jgi:hypothetical protein
MKCCSLVTEKGEVNNGVKARKLTTLKLTN